MQSIELALLDSPWERMVQCVIAVTCSSCCTVGFELGLHRQLEHLGHLGSSLRAPTGRMHRDDTFVVTDARGAVVFVEFLSIECTIGVGAADEMIDHLVEIVVLELFRLQQQDRHELGELIASTGMRCRRCEPIDLVDADVPGQQRVDNRLMTVHQVGTAANFVRLRT